MALELSAGSTTRLRHIVSLSKMVSPPRIIKRCLTLITIVKTVGVDALKTLFEGILISEI